MSQASPEPWTHQLCDELGLTLDECATLDSEGRALITDHGLFVVVNLYGERQHVQVLQGCSLEKSCQAMQLSHTVRHDCHLVGCFGPFC